MKRNNQSCHCEEVVDRRSNLKRLPRLAAGGARNDKIRKPSHRGFTLFELLIAISIFAVTVILVVGSFGISTKNQRQVKANRNLSQNIRWASQEIVRQVELSYNGTISNKRGILITDDRSNKVYNFAVTASPGAVIASLTANNTLFVRDADNHCRYYTLADSRLAVFINNQDDCLGSDYQGPNYLTDENTTINKLEFQGVMNQKENQGQAYVWITIEAKSADEDFDLPLNIKTMAAIRNYGREE